MCHRPSSSVILLADTSLFGSPLVFGYLQERRARCHAFDREVSSRSLVLQISLEDTKLTLAAGRAATFSEAGSTRCPSAYSMASPAALLPLGVRQLAVHGDQDVPVPIDQSRAYVADARSAGDEIELVEVAGADHFDVIDTQHVAWAAVVERLPELFGGDPPARGTREAGGSDVKETSRGRASLIGDGCVVSGHSDMGVAPATWQFAELLLVCEAAGVKADQAEPEFAASIGELTAIKKAAAPRPTQARHRAEATRPRARAFLLQRAPTEESWATQTSKGSAARNISREALDPSLVKVPNGWTYKHASLADVLVSYWASHRRCATSSSIDRWGVVRAKQPSVASANLTANGASSELRLPEWPAELFVI